ncbi:MAG TPA: short-chain dehydrogenase [Gammaproteobacteria bacterium]|nr:short-chain dehydrogenase [Gammaproteobacteria bacterium]
MSETSEGTVIITGCASGIGRAMTTELLASGYSVFGIDKNESGALSEFGDQSNFRFKKIDLADVDKLSSEFGDLSKGIEGPIKALVSNAGIGKMGFLEQLSIADLKLVMDTNFLSHAILTKCLLPRLKKQETVSDIVYTGSEAALKGARQGSIYCASKFALRGFSQALRDECGKSGVRVTLLNPGAVRTPFFEDLHFEPGAQPENAIEARDVAQALLMVLQARFGTVFEEINMSPLTHVWQGRKL